MPKKKRDGGWLLPDNIQEPNRRYYCVPVPDDPQHISAFHGALWTLAQWWQWQRDENQSGKKTADVWRDIIINEVTFSDTCGDGMDCNDLINCDLITDLLDATNISYTINPDGSIDLTPNTGGSAGAGASVFNEVLGDSANCDEDALYAGIRSMVQFCNRAIVDLFEAIETSSNINELVEQVIEALPGLNFLPVDELIAYFDLLQEWTFESYNTAYDIDLENEIICDLFCIAQLNCEIQLETIRLYFEAHLGETMPTDAGQWLNFVTSVLSGTYSGDGIVYGAFAMLFAFSRIFNALNMSGTTDKLVTWYLLGANDPDSDHEILCTSCTDGWCYTNFDNDGAWTPYESGWSVLTDTATITSSAITAGLTTDLYRANVMLQNDAWLYSGMTEIKMQFKATAEWIATTYRAIDVQLLHNGTEVYNYRWIMPHIMNDDIQQVDIRAGGQNNEWDGTPFNQIKVNARHGIVSGGYLKLISFEMSGDGALHPDPSAPDCI